MLRSSAGKRASVSARRRRCVACSTTAGRLGSCSCCSCSPGQADGHAGAPEGQEGSAQRTSPSPVTGAAAPRPEGHTPEEATLEAVFEHPGALCSQAGGPRPNALTRSCRGAVCGGGRRSLGALLVHSAVLSARCVPGLCRPGPACASCRRAMWSNGASGRVPPLRAARRRRCHCARCVWAQPV
jgi:hypothetical protein